jgi:heme/copper-type cytochrome/quinol oxidase subunit 2
MSTLAPVLADSALLGGARFVDLAAFIALAIVWLVIGGVVFALYRIIRSRAHDSSQWGDSPGLQ